MPYKIITISNNYLITLTGSSVCLSSCLIQTIFKDKPIETIKNLGKIRNSQFNESHCKLSQYFENEVKLLKKVHVLLAI